MYYFDTSFLVPLFVPEATTAAVVSRLLTLDSAMLATSLWTRVEFASLIARDQRSGAMAPDDADRARTRFDSAMENFQIIAPEARDFAEAYELLKDHRTGLRGGDALHLAIAGNRGMTAVYSLDKGMIRAGGVLGIKMTSGAVYHDHD